MEEELSDGVKAALSHIHDEYSGLLGVEENTHMLGGFITEEASLVYVRGLSTPHCALEKGMVWAWRDGGPLEFIGARSPLFLWFMYFDSPDEYREDALGYVVEMLAIGEDGAIGRYACKFPADFPEGNAEVFNADNTEFPWELPLTS